MCVILRRLKLSAHSSWTVERFVSGS